MPVNRIANRDPQSQTVESIKRLAKLDYNFAQATLIHLRDSGSEDRWEWERELKRLVNVSALVLSRYKVPVLTWPLLED